MCTRQAPLYIITEYMSHGNLLDYLRKSKNEDLGPSVLMYIASQIAAGMKKTLLLYYNNVLYNSSVLFRILDVWWSWLESCDSLIWKKNLCIDDICRKWCWSHLRGTTKWSLGALSPFDWREPWWSAPLVTVVKGSHALLTGKSNCCNFRVTSTLYVGITLNT